MSAAEQHRSVFRTQAMAPHPQKFPPFPDFMEEGVGVASLPLGLGVASPSERHTGVPPCRLSLRFGDVADLKELVIRFLLSNTYYESTAQNWFSLDSVHILYNRTKEASFNATQIYAPAMSSYHCQHVSSLHKYDTLLKPSSHGDGSLLWHITFIDFQIQAFNVEGGRFFPASDCASFFTPAILIGLVMSLILLLVLAYALHMVLHLKSIEQHDEHRPSVYLEGEAESEPGDKSHAGQ
ncbi:VAS1L protein, partial [Polyodon spathula]|nr:VAS1L protein [Polyodon spathula]